MLLLPFLACIADPPVDTSTPTTPKATAVCDAVPEGLLDVDPKGPDTQIHAFSAVAPDGVWVAYNLPDNQGVFDVFAVHIDCDGVISGPFQLDDSRDNETDPTIAVLGDVALVAWQSDSGAFPDNLDLRWRRVDRSGPVGDVAEAPTSGNTFMPSLAVLGDGFVLAGTTAGVQVFEVFTLVLDATGEPVGPPVDFDADPGGGERWPDVAVDSEGRVHVAWETDEQVFWSVDGNVTLVGEGLAPVLTAGPSGVRLGYGADGDLWTQLEGEGPVRLRGGSEWQHSLSLVADDAGGQAGFMVNEGGLANRVVVGRYDEVGALASQIDVGPTTAAPYGLEVARIAPDIAFVAWAEGTSPAFRVRAAFVRLD